MTHLGERRSDWGICGTAPHLMLPHRLLLRPLSLLLLLRLPVEWESH